MYLFIFYCGGSTRRKVCLCFSWQRRRETLPLKNVLLSPCLGKNSVGERKGRRGKEIPAFCSLVGLLANQWNGEHIGARKGLIPPTLIQHGM